MTTIDLHINGTPSSLARLLGAIAANCAIGDPIDPPQASAPATATMAPPQIGQVWPGQGGIYAGRSRGVDGQVDAHLILAADKPDGEKNWDDALAWAQTVNADGHADFRLPSRAESALLFAHLKDEVGTGWHWTNEQSSRTHAWYQNFSNGYQYDNTKSYEGRARAVRRFIP